MAHPLIIVAMSGGVDSSVTAALLKEQGFHVEGMFMKNWEEDDTEEYCSAKIDLEDAQNVCDLLKIKLHKVNFSMEYWEHVFERFLSEYQAGRTPNPDIWCNKEIKFKAFLDYAKGLGADKIATGHYARVRYQQEHFQLLRGIDSHKDQSYFLYTLQQFQLSSSLFPVGELKKSNVRQIAEKLSLKNHAKKDSTGICFIGARKFRDFLQRYVATKPGAIVDLSGKERGEHMGLMYYTIGQRQGLGVGGQKGQAEQPWYVAGKNFAANQLIVVQGHQHPSLYKTTIICNEVSFVDEVSRPTPFNCTAKIRYRSIDQPCCVYPQAGDTLKVEFVEPQWAITEGQSIVFYQNEVCLGGGIIHDAV